MTKKVLLTLFISIITLSIFAQDIIVTRDGKKINAKISEVDVDVLKYKNFDNTDGPTYSIKKSEIASVIYQNGQVEVFEATKSNNTFNQNQNYSQNNANFSQTKDFNKSKKLRNSGIAMFSSGVVGCLGLGLGLYFGSESYNCYYYDYYRVNEGMVYSGIAFMAAGSALSVGGIICWIAGQNGMNRFKNGGVVLFENSKCDLNMALGANNIGLKLKF